MYPNQAPQMYYNQFGFNPNMNNGMMNNGFMRTMTVSENMSNLNMMNAMNSQSMGAMSYPGNANNMTNIPMNQQNMNMVSQPQITLYSHKIVII